ncbi:phosphoribosylamine--glycine ligase [Sphingorhabdus lutea]|uniref:Phosphoribosylamine--glycine ligase n=1 Tax=Sphingorhabdus lutea TaxID=1913578 RepID=A0A1L3JAC5_9SPHN|nr:phosphoribosylamine--glycine ligase [Sphingorhabdus lutea]APG62069.1 phosphoribosylamine--glycine ligase [Sphingorhabdus lutea]
MNILLIGSGGREHALAWKISQSPSLNKLYTAPGNPGMAGLSQMVEINISNHDEVINFCKDKAINLVVVGPEAPLVAGLVDDLTAANIPAFGPTKAAAMLEGSKGFTKDLCASANIPTAAYVRCNSAEEAFAKLSQFTLPVVIKADGLAAGKGVVIAENMNDAQAAIADMFDGAFGDAGAEIVLEEFMVGEEASFFALTDGVNIIPFGSAQDHKRVGEGDVGPNTGGMGAYSPAPVLTDILQQQAMDRIITPTVRAMAERGTPYSGVLYAGLILTDEGPKLIEYNCRFGDPECQVLMMRFEGDFAKLLLDIATGNLANAQQPQFTNDSVMTVVMAAKGYPASPIKGGAINNLDIAAQTGAQIFHAGTAMLGDQLVSSGGRVLNITARGNNVTMAQKNAYAAIDHIDFADGFYRRDIGWREIAREAAEKA